MITLEVTIDPRLSGFPKDFAAANKQLLKEARPLVRALGQRYVQIARSEAPKKEGRFAASITSQVFSEGNAVGFHGLSAKPIGHWIILGTKPHKIAARNKKALFFFWTKAGMYTVVPKSAGFKTHVAGGKLWIGKGYVNHPGTKPNPFPQRALERLRPEIDKLLERLKTRWIQIMQAK